MGKIYFKIVIKKDQVVYDLGCSIGVMSKLLSKEVKKVIGFDNDASLLFEASKGKAENCEFF